MTKIVPSLYGIKLSKDEFVAKCHAEMKKFTDWSVDELLIHPRQAVRFCNKFRRDTGWVVPDPIILRACITYRKGISRMKKITSNRS